ncbi:hypothetical protein CASFOL_036390 [Castilleja foliolosa]|uniref:rRNA N-glycosylase n=1 Tax=Castilleja foliolosa TaxID=1961234 RepID=A0ABD3BVE5_9LAMI
MGEVLFGRNVVELETLPDVRPNNLDRLPVFDINTVTYFYVPSDYYNPNFPLKYQLVLEHFRYGITARDFYDDDLTEKQKRIRLMGDRTSKKLYNLVQYSDDDEWVVYKFRTRDMYVVGFENKQGKFQLFDCKDCGFQSTTKVKSSHPSLKTFSKCSSSLSGLSLDVIHSNLIKMSSVNSGTIDQLDHQTIAKGVLQTVILIAEASRFQNLSDFIIDNLKKHGVCFNLTGQLRVYFNVWSRLSRVLIMAKEDKIEEATKSIPSLLIFKDKEVTSIDEVKAIIRIVSNEDYEELTKAKSKKPRH